MKYRLIFLIARTHLMAKVKQTAVAALGVTFGIGVFVGMIGFMTGVNHLLDDLTMEGTPHVRLYNDLKVERSTVMEKVVGTNGIYHFVHHQRPKDASRNIRNALQILKELEKDKRIIGAAPRLSTQVFYDFGSVQIPGNIVGVKVLEENRLFNLGGHMQEGRLRDLDAITNGVFLGVGLAKKLSVGVGDRVMMTSSTGAQFQMKVVGIFSLGISAIDDVQGYTNLKTAQRIMDKNHDYISDISMKVHDLSKAGEIAYEFSRRFGVNAMDFKEANAQMELGVKMRNIMTYVVGIALLIVAGFGIYNILNMFIYEKRDDIAILKATGFKGADIQKIFIIEALLTGLIGGVLGLLVGYLISYGIDQIPFEQTFMPSLTTMPVNYDPMHYVIGVTFALLTTFFAGYFPSRKAGKVDPVEIIRGK